MPLIQRLTTQYDAAQDRLRLAIDTDNAGTMVLWLTQRLSQPLIAHLCAWLEQPGPLTTPAQPAPAASNRHAPQQAMAQQIATAQMQPAPTVIVDSDQPEWLVGTVRITCNTQLAELHFSSLLPDAPEPRLRLAPAALRQWLSVVHEQCRIGGWPLTNWPAWMTAAIQETQERPSVLH